MHRAPSSRYHVEYPIRWEKDAALDRGRSDKSTVLQWEQNPSMLKQSFFFCLPVVKELSISHSGLVRWNWDMTTFSKLRVLFCLGVSLLVSESKSQRVKSSVGICWHIEYGYSWLASISTTDLHMFADFRIKVSSTTALRVKLIDGRPTTTSRVFSRRSWSFSWMDRILHQ